VAYSYQVDRQRRIVFAHASGVVTIGEMLSARRKLAANPDFDESFPVVADLREVTQFGFGAEELRHFAEMTKAQHSRITALVVSTTVEYGFARMFQTLRDNADYPGGEIFRDMEAAIRWVEEQREAG
jgi:hypothetical protein